MLKFDFNNVTVETIGSEQGLDIPNLIARDSVKIQNAFKKVQDNKGKGWQEWCTLPDMSSTQVDEIIEYTSDIKNKASDFVVFGIGGSALGPLAVATALMHLRHNYLTPEKQGTERLEKEQQNDNKDNGNTLTNTRVAPRLWVEDNIDPKRMSSLLDVIDIEKTYFNVITKSGETSETLAQFLILYNILIQKLGQAEAKKRIIVTTTIGKGALYETAIKEQFKVYGIGAGIGGRFSVLSPVGLVCFGVMGLDIKAMLRGAKNMGVQASKQDPMQNPAFLSALIQAESMARGKNVSVLMPYADQLKYMADFYCQLWGESLGKAVDNSGKTVNVGQTPVKSLGVTDQHSQVQLYTEGPFDKVVTFISVQDFGEDVTIPKMALRAGLFLADCTLAQLLNAERIATEFALTKAKRANFNITLPTICAESVGELLAYFMYETAYTGALLNIDTFNQPGVEEGKLATFAMLGRTGYDAKLKEIEARVRDDKYII